MILKELDLIFKMAKQWISNQDNLFKSKFQVGKQLEHIQLHQILKNNNYVELMIRQVYKGEATTFVHKALQEADIIDVDGPFGDFYLQEESKRDIICIAGGSGMAPIKSILEYLKRPWYAKKS